jgi:2-polyprenyl-6-methoxyphenol hydroxylase-like FAD-dependent oxidoreductase
VTTTNTPHIAVIGAGPGGLTCARVLQRHGVDVTVYDRDTGADARDQGGTLDMHADKGQIALREAGMLDEFLALARPEGQAHRSMNPQGEVVAEHLPEPGEDAAPEIDRGQLRRLLADSLAPGTIAWGRALSAAVPIGDGRHRLDFADGSRAEADLVIGADGAWSRVRPLVSPATPAYTGVCFVEAHYNDVDTAHPAVAAVVGAGSMFAIADGRGLVAQRNSGGHVRTYIAVTAAPDWLPAAGIDPADTAAVRAALLERFAGWDDRLLALIRENDGPYANRPLHTLPVPHTWTHTPGVTLLGDAAHLMTPFGGFGANLAMLDGAELALSVARSATVDEAITAYERVMLPRAAEHAARSSAERLRQIFGAGEHTPADAPDFAAEAQAYTQRAAARRAQSSRPGIAARTISSTSSKAESSP